MPQTLADPGFGANSELGTELVDPLVHDNRSTNHQGPADLATSHQFAQDEPRADRLSKSDIVRQKCDRKSAAKSDEILDLMLEWLDSPLPVADRLNIIPRLDDDRVDQGPFQRGLMEPKLLLVLR